jgi:hypothetical protein
MINGNGMLKLHRLGTAISSTTHVIELDHKTQVKGLHLY